MTSLTRRLALAAIAPLALATLTACSRTKAGGPVVLNGRIEAPTVDLSPKVAGRVVEVKVREGDRFKAGDLLVTLDLGETGLTVERDRQGLLAAEQRLRDLETGSRKPEIAAAEAEVVDRRAAADLAKKELARQEQLMARKVGVARDLDRARVELERATAALRVSEERLALAREGFRQHQTEGARAEVDRAAAVLAQSETVAREREIRAPADGVVLHRIAEPGLLLGAGQAALTMAFADRLYVRAFVPETQLGRVRQGMPATVSVDTYPGRTFAARVTEISPDAEFTPKAVETRAERVNLVYAAKVDLDAGWKEPLVPGQPAEVAVDPAGAPPAAGEEATRPRAVPATPGR